MKKINRWYPWIMMVGLLCLLALGSRGYSVGQQPAASKPSTGATFDFVRYTKNKPFTLNTLPTTPYGPPWADVLMKVENFLECKGAAVALCYYSGPGPTTPCNPDGLGLANCTCYEIPEGQRYLVDINAILNRDVYLKTVAVCGKDGSLDILKGPCGNIVIDASFASLTPVHPLPGARGKEPVKHLEPANADRILKILPRPGAVTID